MILLQYKKVKRILYLELEEVCKIILKQVWLCLHSVCLFICLSVCLFWATKIFFFNFFANGAKVCECSIAKEED